MNPAQAAGRGGRGRLRGLLRPGSPRSPREGGGLPGVPRNRGRGRRGQGRRRGGRGTAEVPEPAGSACARGRRGEGPPGPAAGCRAAPPGGRPRRPFLRAERSPRPGLRRPGRSGSAGARRGLRRLPGPSGPAPAPTPGPGPSSGRPRGPTARRPRAGHSRRRALPASELLTFCQLPSDERNENKYFFFLRQRPFPFAAQKDGGGAATVGVGWAEPGQD